MSKPIDLQETSSQSKPLPSKQAVISAQEQDTVAEVAVVPGNDPSEWANNGIPYVSSLNGLLIYASVMLAFAAHHDRVNSDEFEDEKSAIRELDFAQNESNESIIKVKSSWDDLIKEKPTRLSWQIYLLILAILAYPLLHVGIIDRWVPASNVPDVVAGIFYFLLFIGVWIAVTIVYMKIRKNQYAKTTDNLVDKYHLVRRGIHSDRNSREGYVGHATGGD